MKREVTSSLNGLLILYRILVLLLLLLLALIACVTVYAFIRPPDSKPLFSTGAAAGRTPSGGSTRTGGGEVNVFNGIGRLRIPVAGHPSGGGQVTLILSIAFPYPAADVPFTEELASHIGDFRSIAADYFASLPAAGFDSLDEEAAKAGILRRYNALLRLGQIDTLYFNDLMIVE
ncbi:MAG: flagellar basal body protein FliL [Treponema sp.]|jgi:flagellar basal body-associated protein FliL|nr:flagellar basal body protein FliL [Treponema sp.]